MSIFDIDQIFTKVKLMTGRSVDSDIFLDEFLSALQSREKCLFLSIELKIII